MSIMSLGQSRWLVRVRVRIAGVMAQKKRIIEGDKDAARAAELQFKADLKTDRRRSLTDTKIVSFGQALSYYRGHTEATLDKITCLLDRLDRDLGTVLLRDLPVRFGDYFELLKSERAYWTGKPFSECTRNKLLSYSKTALNLCLKRGLIERNPLAGFSKVPEEARDRVLSEDEEARLLGVLESHKSYLYWPVRFSLKNPIRRGDLCALTRDNLDRFKPWVHFYASKTRKRKPRETCLPFLDADLLEYFDSLPPECPYLFPRAFEAGEWKPLGDFKRHWHAMLREARIEGFVFHSLKHHSITWMLDKGYSERDLKNLGIQHSPAMVDRYYHHDAAKVLAKWKTAQGTPPQQQQNTI